MKPGVTKLVWAETPSNPLWTITDIAAAAGGTLRLRNLAPGFEAEFDLPGARSIVRPAERDMFHTGAEAVSAAEVVITSLPNGAIVKAVYDDVLAAAPSGALLIDTSTISVDDARGNGLVGTPAELVDRIGSYALQLREARSIADLNQLLQDVMRDTGKVQQQAAQARDHLANARQEVERAEQRIAELEQELRDDELNLDEMREAVRLNAGKAKLEASGGGNAR